MKITLIAAMAHGRVLGQAGQLPWHLPRDLTYFRDNTRGKTVIMGRKTFESIDSKPLPQRRNIVLTRDEAYMASGCDVFNGLEVALKTCRPNEEVMIIGGAHIYALALPIAHNMHLTFIDLEVSGDTYFPEWSEADWRKISEEFHAADDKNPHDCVFTVWERRPTFS